MWCLDTFSVAPTKQGKVGWEIGALEEWMSCALCSTYRSRLRIASLRKARHQKRSCHVCVLAVNLEEMLMFPQIQGRQTGELELGSAQQGKEACNGWMGWVLRIHLYGLPIPASWHNWRWDGSHLEIGSWTRKGIKETPTSRRSLNLGRGWPINKLYIESRNYLIGLTAWYDPDYMFETKVKWGLVNTRYMPDSWEFTWQL